jgi:type IV fimbrial biogenesis protein FimT
MMKTSKRILGFTLVELMVVIAIGMIISAIALPNFISWISRNRLGSVITTLSSDFERGRIRAIRENSFVVTQFTDTGYEMFIDNGTGGGTASDGVRNGAEVVIQRRIFPSGVTIKIEDLALANARVRFNSRGVAPDLGGEEVIAISNKSGQRTLSLNRLGKVTTQ